MCACVCVTARGQCHCHTTAATDWAVWIISKHVLYLPQETEAEDQLTQSRDYHSAQPVTHSYSNPLARWRKTAGCWAGSSSSISSHITQPTVPDALLSVIYTTSYLRSNINTLPFYLMNKSTCSRCYLHPFQLPHLWTIWLLGMLHNCLHICNICYEFSLNK